MSITFRIERFEGPLDLLLQLVEQKEFEISQISLAEVAEQFVEHVHQNPQIPPEELADFLMVAAKLIYLKSKQLLPSLYDEELEEGVDLETQLREYQRFMAAAKQLDNRWKTDQRAYTRLGAERGGLKRAAGFIAPIGVTSDLLRYVMCGIIARLEPFLRLPQVSVERTVTIQEKIQDLFRRIKKHARITFTSFVAGAQNKTERVVSFLALLELIKQKFVQVEQGKLFQEIAINAHPDALKQLKLENAVEP